MTTQIVFETHSLSTDNESGIAPGAVRMAGGVALRADR